MAASEVPQMDAFAMLRQHPRLVAFAALGAGVVLGVSPQLRKTVGLGVLQILRRALAAHTGIPLSCPDDPRK
jgi:hypothetical protein